MNHLLSLLFLFGLYLPFQAFSQSTPPLAAVKSIYGIPTLHINGKAHPPFAYMSYFGETEYYREAAGAGIRLYCFPAYLGNRGINTRSGIGPFRPGIWCEENKFDYDSIIMDFEKILAADPKAQIIIRLNLDPPEWWEKAHPDACRLLSDGRTFRQCFASEKWRTATGNALRMVLRWLMSSPFRKNLIGIHLAAGGTEEWFYHINEFYDDSNPVLTKAFQEWLREKYSNVTFLRQTWLDNTVDFETAVPADISGRHREKCWRNSKTEQHVLDTFRFHTETLVKNIIYFCKLTKDASDGQLLTGAFYGYHYFVTDARRGHGSMKELLECNELDFLSSPNVYHRVMGEDWPPMSAIQSVQLHGKLWLAENDTRTSQTTLLKERAPEICPPGMYESRVWQGPLGVQTSVALLRKNSARMLAQNYGGWWFDMWGGWFSHPDFLQVLQETQTLWQQYALKKNSQMQSEICILLDEELAFYDASLGGLADNILSNRYTLGKIGTPSDLFLRSDWSKIKKNHYRLIWLLGVPELTPTEILEFSRQNALVLWTNTLGTTVLSPYHAQKDFSGKFKWTPIEFSQFLQQAGVHRYLETEDVLYVGNGWLSIHTVSGGKRKIQLPFSAKVVEPLLQKVIEDSCRSFEIDLPARSTTILRVELQY